MLKIVWIAGALALAAPALAQTTPDVVAPMDLPQTCGEAQMRQLDFWVGEWTVHNTADNVPYGDSRIEKVFGGCGIREIYTARTKQLYVGTSYSGWDRKDGQWHQMYVDTNGNVTWYSGGLDGKDMSLTAAAKGGATQKMVYSPKADGSVTQVGTVTTDGGKTWQPGYDYTYRRK